MRKDLILLGIIGLLVVVAAVVISSNYRSSQNTPAPVASNNSNANANRGPAPTNTEALVRPDSPTIGPANARVTVVEFYDPECETCAAFSPVVKSTVEKYKAHVRLVARYMPLHPNSLTAATFTEAAGEQGKYWQAQELLFKKQSEWGTRHGPPTGDAPPDIDKLFRGYATELGLDSKRMDAAFAENRYAAKLDRDKKDGQSLGVRQTPTIFVNGRKLQYLVATELEKMIQAEIAQ